MAQKFRVKELSLKSQAVNDSGLILENLSGSTPVDSASIPLSYNSTTKKVVRGTGVRYTTAAIAPTSPNVGDYWEDTNSNPPLRNTWDGTTWKNIEHNDIVTIGTIGSGADYICDGTNDEVEFLAALNFKNYIFVLDGAYSFGSTLTITGTKFIKGLGNVTMTGNISCVNLNLETINIVGNISSSGKVSGNKVEINGEFLVGTGVHNIEFINSVFGGKINTGSSSSFVNCSFGLTVNDALTLRGNNQFCNCKINYFGNGNLILQKNFSELYIDNSYIYGDTSATSVLLSTEQDVVMTKINNTTLYTFGLRAVNNLGGRVSPNIETLNISNCSIFGRIRTESSVFISNINFLSGSSLGSGAFINFVLTTQNISTGCLVQNIFSQNNSSIILINVPSGRSFRGTFIGIESIGANQLIGPGQITLHRENYRTRPTFTLTGTPVIMPENCVIHPKWGTGIAPTGPLLGTIYIDTAIPATRRWNGTARQNI